MRKALNRAWGVEDPRPLAQAKAIDLLLVLLIGAIVAVSFALTIAARLTATLSAQLEQWLGPAGSSVGRLVLTLGPVVPALVAFVALAVLFSTVPAKETRLRDTWPGRSDRGARLRGRQFSDGLLVEREFLREHWRAPVRALAVAMPLNAALLAGTAKALFGELSWVEAFLVGFVLSPTDPVITSSVVTSAKVPVRVRNILNLESGLNDGLALPFVLLFLELSTGEAGSVLEATGSLGLETVLGLAAGVVLALAAGGLLGRLPDWALERR